MIRGLFILVTMFGSFADAETFPYASAPEEHRVLFDSIKPAILENGRSPVKPLSESSESWFWINAHNLNPLLDAYDYSGDPAFLDVFVDRMKAILGQRYVHPTEPETWSGWYHFKVRTHSYMVIHAGIVYYKPALRFIEAIRARPDLQSRYGILPNIWLEDITQVSIPAWDRRGCWKEIGEDEGWYIKITQKPDPETHELVPEADRLAGTTFAFNKLHEMLNGFLIAWRITGNEGYRERIEKCARIFRRHWRVDETHAEWHYRELLGPWDYKSGQVDDGDTYHKPYIHPKGGYYGTDVGYVVACYNHGIQFDRADIEKLIQTNLDFMYRGEDAEPRFTNINGAFKIYEEKEKRSWGRGSLWTSLAQFSPRVRELWKAQIDRSDPDSYGYPNSAMSYLLALSKPISWDRKYVSP